MPPAYATEADLTAFLPAGTVVDDADRLLARASELLDGTVLTPFAVDSETDLPTDEEVAAAMRDACCAVVEQWLEVGEENDVDGLAGTQVSLTGYSGQRAPSIAPRAFRILQTAGLMNAGTLSAADEFFRVGS